MYIFLLRFNFVIISKLEIRLLEIAVLYSKLLHCVASLVLAPLAGWDAQVCDNL